jgi:hypothetical protein
VAGLVIQHDSFRKALALLTDFLDNMYFDDGGALCAVISAPGRCGKSTLSAVLEKMLLDRQPPPRRGDPAYPRKRVLYVLTPQAATPLSLGQTILISAGDPAAARLSQALVTNRVAETLSYCDTELLILDEFHHLFTTGSRAKAVEVASWLKTLLNTGVCGIILIGTEEINLVMAADTQLAGRCWCEATLAPFGFGDKTEKASFTKLISTLAKEQSLPLDPGLGASGLASAVHLATGGTIGEVALLLRKAEAKAKRAGLAMLTAETFRQAFDDRRFESPGMRKGVNPFDVLA